MSASKNCPETVRQKMIGMMYLVLTAMLAINISTQVLQGFTMVDNSLHKTIESSESRIANLHAAFQLAYKANEKKTEGWYQMAIEATNKSDSLFNYISDFKKAILKQIRMDDSLRNKGKLPFDGIDNLDVSADYAINKGNGKIFREKIENFRTYIIEDIFEEREDKIKVYNEIFSTKGRPQKDGTYLNWENMLFDGIPVSAVITMLTKYQNDVRNAEMDIIQFLLGQIDVSDKRVNKVEAFVIPSSRIVSQGGKYQAEIVLAAVDTTKTPEITVLGTKISVKGTKGIWTGPTSKIGEQKFSGWITLPEDPNTKYPFNDSYFVSEPTATISNMDLDVMFLGYDHKFKIAVPSVASENIDIKVSGGGATFTSQGQGNYTIKASQIGDVKVEVFNKSDKGASMGSRVFKVKRLPRPTAFVQDRAGNEKEGRIAMNDLRGASIVASYGPDAVISAKFTVVSFTMVMEGTAPKNVVGDKLDEAFLNKLQRGKNLIINSIVVRGPGGEQTLGTIGITAM